MDRDEYHRLEQNYSRVAENLLKGSAIVALGSFVGSSAISYAVRHLTYAEITFFRGATIFAAGVATFALLTLGAILINSSVMAWLMPGRESALARAARWPLYFAVFFCIYGALTASAASVAPEIAADMRLFLGRLGVP